MEIDVNNNFRFEFFSARLHFSRTFNRKNGQL